MRETGGWRFVLHQHGPHQPPQATCHLLGHEAQQMGLENAVGGVAAPPSPGAHDRQTSPSYLHRSAFNSEYCLEYPQYIHTVMGDRAPQDLARILHMGVESRAGLGGVNPRPWGDAGAAGAPGTSSAREWGDMLRIGTVSPFLQRQQREAGWARPNPVHVPGDPSHVPMSSCESTEPLVMSPPPPCIPVFPAVSPEPCACPCSPPRALGCRSRSIPGALGLGSPCSWA